MIVGHYQHSVQARERLSILQKNMGKPAHKLIQDIDTRWNSEYYMFARLLEQKGPISAELAENSKIENFSQSEWCMIGNFVAILQPIYQATVELSADSYPTLSMVIPVISSIQRVLENHISKGIKGSGLTFVRNLIQAFRARFPDYRISLTNTIAMIIDPRFKAILLSKEEATLAIDSIARKIVSKMEGNKESETAAKNLEMVLSPNEASSSLWTEFDELAKRKPVEVITPCVQQQTSTYLDETFLDRKEDPYLWRRNNGERFHYLQVIAHHYMSIPATQVSRERLFSAAGNVVSVRRGNLQPEHEEQLVFLHCNL